MRKLYLDNGNEQFKFADTTTEIRLNAFDDGRLASLTSDAKVRIKNDSGYLLEVSASVTNNQAVITSGQLAQLPAGNYLLELWDTVDSGTAIYPSAGFLRLQINENATDLSGKLVSSITVDDFFKQFSDLSQQVSEAVANGLNLENFDISSRWERLEATALVGYDTNSLLAVTAGAASTVAYSYTPSDFVQTLTVPKPTVRTEYANCFMIYKEKSKFYLLSFDSVNNGVTDQFVTISPTDDDITIDWAACRKAGYSKIMVAYNTSDANSKNFKSIVTKYTIPGLTTSGDKFDNIKLDLPPSIYTVLGMQTVLYLDNILVNGRFKDVADISISPLPSGTLDRHDKLYFTPKEVGTTEITFNLDRYCYGSADEAQNVASVVVPDKFEKQHNVKVLMIGDSKVGSGWPAFYLQKDATGDSNLVIELLGTVKSTVDGNQVSHEGRGGWRAHNYAWSPSYNGVVNPFYNPDTKAFDFSYYLSQTRVEKPDVVYINLGTNDASWGEEKSAVSDIEKMVQSIHSVDPSIWVVIGLSEMISYSQNWQSKREVNTKIHDLHQGLIAKFAGSESQKIILCPLYVSMDMEEDYTMSNVPLSQRDADLNTGKTYSVLSDEVHQSKVGYWKNADAMYAVLRYIISKAEAE